jgi:hypothetical protein
LSLSRVDGWLRGRGRRKVGFLANTLTPIGDAFLFVVPLETSGTRHQSRGIQGREVEGQREEERQKQQMAHQGLF